MCVGGGGIRVLCTVQDELGLAVALAYFGSSEGRNQLSRGLGKLVFLEKEKQLLEHECWKEVFFPTANPQDTTVIQSQDYYTETKGDKTESLPLNAPRPFANGTIPTNARSEKARAINTGILIYEQDSWKEC